MPKILLLTLLYGKIKVLLEAMLRGKNDCTNNVLLTAHDAKGNEIC